MPLGSLVAVVARSNGRRFAVEAIGAPIEKATALASIA
jgi:hypothetical protein